MGLRDKARGMARRRLMKVRSRIDRRIDRLDQKRARLDAKIEKRAPVAGESPVEEPKTE